MHNLLPYRLLIVNTCGAVGLFYAWQASYVTKLFATDSTNISYAIAALFVVGLLSTFHRAIKVSSAINLWRSHALFQPDTRQKIAKMGIKSAHLKSIADWLTGLGLLGTIIGLRIALDGSAMDDPKMVQEGMFAALGTTIIGLILSLWTRVNLRILTTATHSLQEDVR